MKPLIIANWKLNPLTQKEAKELFDAVSRGIKDIKEAEVVVCPPFIYLPVAEQESGVKSGAQNCFWEERGAYTGEISPSMLKDIGCQYVIIGHSERRKYFYETDEMVNKKSKAVLGAGLIPIICIGETELEREEGKTEQIVEKEIEQGLKGVDFSKIVIAYEPIWAIGTGNPCDIEEAKRMKEIIQKMTLKNIKIIYGGSVNSSNAEGYIKGAGYNGLLVGGASLKLDEFISIIKQSL